MSNSVAPRWVVAMPRNRASEFRLYARDAARKFLNSPERHRVVASPRKPTSETGLYAPDGSRKYLNQTERQRFVAALTDLPPDRALFALMLAWTGARVSEVLALRASSFQIERGIVAIQTLKRRKPHVREVPIPPELAKALDRHYGILGTARDPRGADSRLWPWHRTTAYRAIRQVMRRCGIAGRHACPRGLRHAFGVGTLQSGVPLNLTQRWMGHARISTTAVYADVSGPEEQAFASKFWHP